MKNMKKAVAVTLSAAMVMGMSVQAMAADGDPVDVTAPIYSVDLLSVIVPTTYAVAFNPDGLTVQTGANASDTATAQVLSKNYGIINKSSKDKLITVALTVEDQNTANGVTFVDTAADVTNAAAGEFKIHLTAVPADNTGVKVSGTAVNKDTAPGALDDVEMTEAADTTAVTLKAGKNKIGFKLDKATIGLKDGSSVVLGTDGDNNLSDKYEAKSLGTNGATAFTFAGTMNASADWSKLTSGIKITAVYSNENAPSSMTVISGTGAMVALPADVAPTFSSSNVGEITYTAGSGDDALASITSITMDSNGTAFDGFAALSGAWGAATDSNGTITFDDDYISAFAADFTDATKEATVTYKTAKGEDKTATVQLKIR